MNELISVRLLSSSRAHGQASEHYLASSGSWAHPGASPASKDNGIKGGHTGGGEGRRNGPLSLIIWTLAIFLVIALLRYNSCIIPFTLLFKVCNSMVFSTFSTALAWPTLEHLYHPKKKPMAGTPHSAPSPRNHLRKMESRFLILAILVGEKWYPTMVWGIWHFNLIFSVPMMCWEPHRMVT